MQKSEKLTQNVHLQQHTPQSWAHASDSVEW